MAMPRSLNCTRKPLWLDNRAEWNMHESNGARWNEMVSALRLPVVVAPMFLVSGPRLVVASCRQGLIGSFPTAYPRTAEDLERWFQEIERDLAELPGGAAPYAANLIVHPTNPRMDIDLDLICEHRVPIVIASVGNPARIVERVHDYGGVVLTDVARVSHARKAISSGVDGLILLCAGAGGHTGWINPFAFARAVRAFYDGPVILAGGIADGSSLHAARVLGADLAYIGTRFIAASESDAKPDYQQMIVDSNADDIVLTAAVSGLPANWLKKSLEVAGYTDLGQPAPGGFSFAEKLKAWRDVWGAGHGVGSTVSTATVEDIVFQLEREYLQASGADVAVIL
jgi:nitronate monooxygenase